MPPVAQLDAPGQDMRDAIQWLTRLVAAQAQHQEASVDPADRAISVRVKIFLGLDPPEYSGLRQNMDPQDFIDSMQRTLRTYAQNMEDRKRQRRTERERDRGYGKKARSLDVVSDFREGQRQQYFRYPSHSAASAPPRFSGQMRPPFPRCAQCGRFHAGQCRLGSDACYAYGQPGHVMRECPSRGDVGIVQPTGSVGWSSSSVHPSRQGSPTPTGRGRGKGGATSSSGPQNRIYALAGR
ncbi:uncharacterized protein LOC132611937 [Lycium barbarum]|uniref:uncharacterized protein LOC132611937 n=1 Tax=Lycium barbarum TaxID=112863 RepID=UPI00293E3989|nr:uncharacterized protein LOC132611937 [Lycium barbarum]